MEEQVVVPPGFMWSLCGLPPPPLFFAQYNYSAVKRKNVVVREKKTPRHEFVIDAFEDSPLCAELP